jgi:hypothetical protein
MLTEFQELTFYEEIQIEYLLFIVYNKSRK